ncbi:MAG TPA: HD domain-containing protein [Planctomycetaceae bacterium]|nr:HD domain-containing protein [Planctomycetaceae bacterium]
MSHPYSDIPELSQAGDECGVVRIPTEQDVPFTPRVRAIVDSREFQRLRNITQLALASHVYPGATHTRFEHALGVYHNALRYLWQLGRDTRFAEIVSAHDAEVLIVAALLHDIGHWPFCHPIEDMELPQMPPHEVFAREFLRPDSELTQVLESRWGITADEVLDVLVAKSDSPSSRLRRSILSGPIDIDKMDYLSRDSQHCGVPYGRHFDRNRLINSLIVNEAGDGLAITSKGRTAAEMMVFARYVMFTEVYWHHAVRSATTMFARSFLELMPALDLNSLFRMSEPDLIRCLQTASQGTPVASLTAGLFGSNRRLHKRLAEYSIYHQEPLYRALRQLTSQQLATLSSRLTEQLSKEIGRELSPVDVLIDAPPQHREVEFRVDVWFRSSNEYRPLREVSPIVDAMAKTQFDDCVKKVRIFAAPYVRELIPVDFKMEALIQDQV